MLPVEHQPTEEIIKLFRDLLEFPAFKSAPVLSSILLYLWNHQSEPVTEYAIAVDALGRAPSFDPKSDASVRVLIGRLRARLREFYESEPYPLKLSIPVGTHEIHWILDEQQLEAAPIAVPPPVPLAVPPVSTSSTKLLAGALGLIVLLAALCGLLFEQNRMLRMSERRVSSPLPRFWSSFLTPGQVPAIVVPSLVHFSWPKQNLAVRDLTIADFAGWSKSAAIRELARMWGPPELMEGYVARIDMEAGVQFLNYLNGFGVQANIVDSTHFQNDVPGARSTIYVGSPYRAAYLNGLLAGADFYLSDAWSEAVVVHNRRPALGEPTEYREIDYSGTHRIYPGLILMLPPTPDGGKTLILLGKAPLGLASVLATRSSLGRLDELWRNAGSPPSWEMVLEEEINQGTILRTTPIAIRPIPVGR